MNWYWKNRELALKKQRAYYKRKRRENPLSLRLMSIRSRCSDKKRNWFKKGIKCFLTIKDLKFLWIRDRAYLLKEPSIDRIDNDGHYTLDNCHFIELRENSAKENIGRKDSLELRIRRGKAIRKYPPICKTDGCNNSHFSKGFCAYHWRHWYKTRGC